MKLLENIKKLIIEASKKKILMDKIGFNEENADILDQLCGSLSVWMAKKMMGVQQQHATSWGNPPKEGVELIDKMNNNGIIQKYRPTIQSIMDWVRVGLNGNVKQYQDLSFLELNGLSKEWHDSLEVGQGDINYIEKNPILLDFRDEQGNGFYWTDLETKNSDEECDRMGHCGRSSYGYLYSLRQVIPINNKYKLNKSVLTAAIGKDGIMYQLKGHKNSKPDEKYHQYILPLFFVLGGGGEDDYLIQGFGTEYASEQDFKLSDLPEETIKELYQNRPDLFSSMRMQRLLGKMGIVDVEQLPTTFSLEIKPEDFEDYIDGGWDNTYKNRATGGSRKVSIFTEIMEGDAFSLWNQDGNEDFGGYFQYTIDEETEKKLWGIVKTMSERDGVELDTDLNLRDAVEKVDDDWEIRNAISGGINDADADDYVNYLQGSIRTALETYGNVYELNDTGAKIQIDITDLVDIDNDEVNEIYEDNYNSTRGYDYAAILDGLVTSDLIERPTFDFDDRWYPSPDSNVVNENINDRLDDINI